MRIEPNSRGSYDADFEQFSRFLRGSRTARESMPCNSGNATAPSQPTAPDNQNIDTSIAMVYAPKQRWQNIYDPEIALVNGTIFEELDKPFYPTGCSMNNGCRGNSTGGCRR